MQKYKKKNKNKNHTNYTDDANDSNHMENSDTCNNRSDGSNRTKNSLYVYFLIYFKNKEKWELK